jgi:YD repeat-containing protein
MIHSAQDKDMKTMNANKLRLMSALCGAVLFTRISGTSASNISYTYDPAGRLVAADYGAGKSTSYAYDNAGNLIVSSQPSPGLLVSRPSASQINLFWPAAPAGFMLYSSGSLATGASWNLSGAAQSQMGDFNVVTQTFGPANAYYRLQK